MDAAILDWTEFRDLPRQQLDPGIGPTLSG